MHCPQARPIIVSAVSTMLAVMVVASGAHAETVFIESGGIVVVEVESCPPSGGWKVGTELAGFTGSCYYTDNGGGVLKYRILITNPGKYNLRIHNRHDFADSTLQNDCFTRMDDGPRWKTFSHARGQWTWTTNHEHSGGKPPASYELDAGHHVFEISARSAGFSIDRFHLYRDDVDSPTDTSRPESRSGPSIDTLEHNPIINKYVERGALGAALKAATKARSSKDADAAAEAREAEDALLAYARNRRDEIARVKGVAPVEAVELLADLAKQYAGCDRGKELTAEAREWSRGPEVREARQAQRVYAQIEDVAKHMRGKGKATDPVFARRYRQQIKSIITYVVFLQKKYPNTPGCRKAVALSRELGIQLDD